jgi:hypothetical protein
VVGDDLLTELRGESGELLVIGGAHASSLDLISAQAGTLGRLLESFTAIRDSHGHVGDTCADADCDTFAGQASRLHRCYRP